MNRHEYFIKILNENYSRKEELEKEKKSDVESEYSEDIWDNFYVDLDKNIYEFKNEIFQSRTSQEKAFPFENETIRQMIEVPKIAIYPPYIDNKEGIQGVFLIGNDNGRPILYALTIKINEQDLSNFCIKLDTYIKNDKYFQLLRLDYFSEDAQNERNFKHPNYIKNGKPIKDISQIEFVKTPHLHINTKECQVLHPKADYSTAKYIDLEKIGSKDDSTFAKGVKYFMEKINLLTELNLNLNKGSVIDKNKLINANTIKDAMEEFSK